MFLPSNPRWANTFHETVNCLTLSICCFLCSNMKRNIGLWDLLIIAFYFNLHWTQYPSFFRIWHLQVKLSWLRHVLTHQELDYSTFCFRLMEWYSKKALVDILIFWISRLTETDKLFSPLSANSYLAVTLILTSNSITNVFAEMWNQRCYIENLWEYTDFLPVNTGGKRTHSAL